MQKVDSLQIPDSDRSLTSTRSAYLIPNTNSSAEGTNYLLIIYALPIDSEQEQQMKSTMWTLITFLSTIPMTDGSELIFIPSKIKILMLLNFKKKLFTLVFKISHFNQFHTNHSSSFSF